MAGTIAPRMKVEGTAHRVEKRTLAATDTHQARTVANVVVLTDGGGFIEVYIDSEKMVDCPDQGARLAWLCDVGLWNRQRRDGAGTYATLHVKLVESVLAATADHAAPQLHSA